jgi:2-oxo-4-hydroxy-4-carboxy-5-ureidoimidazoline decarboxylase
LKYEISEVNALDQPGFVALLGGVFEHSPWVAERAWSRRPFADRAALHAAMVAEVMAAPVDAQLALICAHPELAGREATPLTADSAREQRGAGLDQCSPDELRRLHEMNAAWRARFGHPFIVAVKGLDRAAILARMEARVGSEPEAEREECLRQIARIAAFRLDALIEDPHVER